MTPESLVFALLFVALVGIPVAASLHDSEYGWHWSERAKLARELELAKARVLYAEKGIELRKRELAAQAELDKLRGAP